MSALTRAGQPGALDHQDIDQESFQQQIGTLVDMIRQLGGNARVVAGALAQADPLNSPFTLYVNPYIGSDRFIGGSYNSFEADGTDDEIIAAKLKRIELQRLECGYTPYRPFRTVNRAVIEAAIITSKDWYTYTDPRAHVDCVSIVLAPGVHVIYNDPGSASSSLISWGSEKDPTISDLVAFNPPVEGGLLLPRGCSLCGPDLRKTTLRPSWVPAFADEQADYSNRRAILKVTGTGYFFGYTGMDKLGLQESHHLLDLHGPASKEELDGFYEKVESAVGAGADLASALLVTRSTEHEIVGPIDLGQAPTAAWDTTASASPYIFNCSIRSDYGLGGAFWDGDKVGGLKSMVCANFTGVSKQKDMRCWQIYFNGNWFNLENDEAGYQAYINASPDDVRMDPRRMTRHITAVNDAFIQEVSVFGIGQAGMNTTDSGGEITVTNSNSTFGGCAAISRGYKRAAFPKDQNWTVGRVRVPLSAAERSIVSRIYLGTVQAVTSSTITLSTGLAISAESGSTPAVLLSDGYTLAGGSRIWIENPTGSDWRAPLTGSAWSSSTPAQINISSQLLEAGSNAVVGLDSQGVNRAIGKRVYIRRLVDGRLARERRVSLLLNNTASVRLPRRNFVLQTDPARSGGSIARALQGGGSEVLLVSATGTGPLPGAGVAKTSEITIRRGSPTVEYADATYYTVGTVVRHAGKHFQAKRTLVSSGPSPDPRFWGEAFVHMPSTYNPEESILRESPRLIFDTDTSDDQDSTSLGIDWATIWTAAGSVRDQYRSGTDYRGAHAFLVALGFSAAAAHNALVPQTAAARDRDPSSSVAFPVAPSGGAATGLGNWAVEFRRPSVLRLYGHAWEWAGFGNYSKALPAVQQDMSEFNKFTYFFTHVEGGRVVPQGSNEDGFNVTPRGLEDIETGATIGVDDLDGQEIDEGLQSDFPNGINAGGTSSFQDVFIRGQLNAGDNAKALVSRQGLVGLAGIQSIDTETFQAANDQQIEAASDKVVVLPALERWRESRGLLSAIQPPAVLIVLHVASSPAAAITGTNSVPRGYIANGHGYDPTNGVGLQRLLFNTVTAALDAASRIYVPPGAEVVVSVHDTLTTVEPGPLVIGNGLTQWVCAGARTATAPKVLLRRSTMIMANSRFPQLPGLSVFSAGGIFADLEVEIDLDGISPSFGNYLTLDGGFAVGERDTIIRWKNVGSGARITNATCFYGGKIQMRAYMNSTTADRRITTIVERSGNADPPLELNFFGQEGGLLGQGANMTWDFQQGYGSVVDNFRTKTVILTFDHNYPDSVPLKFLELGGRGGCKSGSRVAARVMWDFSGKQWDLSSFISIDYRLNANYQGQAFGTIPMDIDTNPAGANLLASYGISGATAETLAERTLAGGCVVAMTNEISANAGPFSLLVALEGRFRSGTSGPTVPDRLFSAENFRGSYVYTTSNDPKGRNILTP